MQTTNTPTLNGGEGGVTQVTPFEDSVACVASVSNWFWNKERLRKGIFGFGRAENGTRVLFFMRSLTLVPCFLLGNCTEMLARQAKDSVATILLPIVASLTNKTRKTDSTWSPVIRHVTCSWWWGLLS